MPKLHWEDFELGAVAIYGPRLVTREEIVAFAAEFDPQPMHLDEAAASATLLGGLGASGWHTCCLTMRMIADGFLLNSSSMGAPGIEEVRWLAKMNFEVLDDADAIIMTLVTTFMLGRRS